MSVVDAMQIDPTSIGQSATPSVVPDILRETKLFQKAINDTAVDLYQQFSLVRSKENKNFVFFTPNLIASLSMLYAGAPAKLKVALEKSLHLGELTGTKWHSRFQVWSETLQDRSRASVSAMLKTSFTFQQTQIITSHSSAPLIHQARMDLFQYNPEMFSFSTPEEAKKTINQRVAEKTEGKIPNLVDNVDDKLVLIMASVALFKGQWQYPFEKRKNSEEVFYNSDGTKVRVEMMNKGLDDLRTAWDRDDHNYAFNILELPFFGDISLLLLKPRFDQHRQQRMPGDNYGLVQDCAEQLKTYMSQNKIQDLLANYDTRFKKTSALSIGIPKINLKDKSDLLKELNHTQWAQEIAEANFSGSLVKSDKPTRTPQLVSEVNFTMDEEGAVVAAASYSPTNYQSCDPTFKLNGPFGLVMVDRTTQTILGMGQVLKMDGKAVTKEW